MYSTCLFCKSPLGRNSVIESFPVGRALAFDSAQGRLWVVCRSCSQWNLTPMEERWEAVEQCERRFKSTTVRVSTDNVALAQLPEDMILIRIGAPLRPEFAAWRYATNFARRRTRANIANLSTVAGAGVAAVTGIALGSTVLPALTTTALSIVAIPMASMIAAGVPILGAVALRDYFRDERVVARLLTPQWDVITLRAKHLESTEVEFGSDDEFSLLIPETGSTGHVLRGAAARDGVGVVLASVNRGGATKDVVAAAVKKIEDAGDSQGFLRATADHCRWRGGRFKSVMGQYRNLGAIKSTPIERLALEMSVHEDRERRAMRGELHDLEMAWKRAEHIAQISDGELTPMPGDEGKGRDDRNERQRP